MVDARPRPVDRVSRNPDLDVAKAQSTSASQRHAGDCQSRDYYSVMIRSDHSTSETNMAGLPNFAPHWFKSVSVTPRAREQAPQAKIGMCFATTFSSISLNGGQPTGITAFAVTFRIK